MFALLLLCVATTPTATANTSSCNGPLSCNGSVVVLSLVSNGHTAFQQRFSVLVCRGGARPVCHVRRGEVLVLFWFMHSGAVFRSH